MQPERITMKLSRFIICAECDDNPNLFLLYNTRTTAFVSLEKSIYEDIFVKDGIGEPTL